MGVQDAAQAHPTPADLLDGQSVSADVQRQATVFFRDYCAEQAELFHALDQFGGVLVVMFHLLGHRINVPANELADGADDATLGF